MSEPAAKKQKTVVKPAYKFNINNALDKKYETWSLKALIKQEPAVLQGVGPKTADMFTKLKITTIEELGQWKAYQAASAIATMAATEEEGKRNPEGDMNLNAALDKKFETSTLKEMLAAPPSSIQGLAGWADEVLAESHIKTVGDLATFKYCKWAEAMVTLSQFENADHSS